ncbi:hypothetical protein [Streptomyces triticirhizae]|uniref:Uncharacterized protein n=1 Tax=Streptomyces triticirhizae TaxID=2483353 RepID=A0A3M2MB62_9ACTN|nr:hypothetical protein [Streptomyces triticirhizae]RMI44418.1 hypothetical protein EBN88_05300 [Streptomyces triticirhizae]
MTAIHPPRTHTGHNAPIFHRRWGRRASRTTSTGTTLVLLPHVLPQLPDGWQPTEDAERAAAEQHTATPGPDELATQARLLTLGAVL